MTKTARFLCAILLIVSAFLLFVPVATFEDNSAAALQEEIDKQVGRLESEQAKLQRYIDQGKKQADLDKQQTKIDKQQAKVDELLAEQAALASQAGQSGLKDALMPGKLPEEIQVNMQVVNEGGGIYPTDFSDLYLATKLAAALLVVAVMLPLGMYFPQLDANTWLVTTWEIIAHAPLQSLVVVALMWFPAALAFFNFFYF